MDDILPTVLASAIASLGTIVVGFFTLGSSIRGQNRQGRSADHQQRDTALGKAADIALQAVEPFRQIVKEQNAQIAELRESSENATAELLVANEQLARLKEDNDAIVRNLQVLMQSLLLLIHRMDSGEVDEAEKHEMVKQAEEAINHMRSS